MLPDIYLEWLKHRFNSHQPIIDNNNDNNNNNNNDNNNLI